MPFNQMMLFPTEFKLVTTRAGLRMRAAPVQEIRKLQGRAKTWSSLTAVEANQALDKVGSGPVDVRLTVTLENDDELAIRYQGNTIAAINYQELENGTGSLDVLIDKAVAEIFVDGGARYIVRELPTTSGGGLAFGLGKNTSAINRLEIFPMKSMWKTPESSKR
jgi:sucrose-6-phosphate hydrolase SacC (GH32 family)